MKQGRPAFVAVVMLVGTWSLLQSLSHGEPVLSKRPFSEFPMSIADRWDGRELGMEQHIVDLLGVTDYMMRLYHSRPPVKQDNQVKQDEPDKQDKQDRAAPVMLYIGYYESQRTGATYHSPKNCLPGAGWQIEQSDYVTVPVSEDTTITINKVLIQKDMEKQLILYWYQDRGRAVASEYTAKAYFLWDAMTKNRTDGSLVRVSVPVVTSPDDAYEDSLQFLRDTWPLLGDYFPKGIETS
jgi:EpsI family protein